MLQLRRHSRTLETRVGPLHVRRGFCHLQKLGLDVRPVQKVRDGGGICGSDARHLPRHVRCKLDDILSFSAEVREHYGVRVGSKAVAAERRQGMMVHASGRFAGLDDMLLAFPPRLAGEAPNNEKLPDCLLLPRSPRLLAGKNRQSMQSNWKPPWNAADASRNPYGKRRFTMTCSCQTQPCAECDGGILAPKP